MENKEWRQGRIKYVRALRNLRWKNIHSYINIDIYATNGKNHLHDISDYKCKTWPSWNTKQLFRYKSVFPPNDTKKHE